MLREAIDQGRIEALRTLGVKEADVPGWARSAWEGVKASPGAIWQGLTGNPEARSQLVRGGAFAPGGQMHWQNVLWPTGGNAAMRWIGRASTVLPALEAYSALRGRVGDPREGRLTNALASAGQALGSAYGFPAGGMIGSGILGTVGRRIGTGLGRTLGSKPASPPAPDLYHLQYEPGAPL